MANSYKFIVPTITIAPPRGFSITDFFPVQQLGNVLRTKTAAVTITWELMRNGTLVNHKTVTLMFEDGKCRNPDEAFYQYGECDDEGWDDGGEIGYIETRVVLTDDDKWFRLQNLQQNYATYTAPDRKSFFGNQTLKYSDALVITQIRSFRQWLEGYPACRLDPENDIDLSVALINPYERPALVNIQFVGLQKKRRVRVQPRSATRVSLSSCLDDEDFPWLGQIYVSGVNRVPCFMIHHSHADPYEIGKLEHLDPFRGSVARLPFTQALHVRKRIGRI